MDEIITHELKLNIDFCDAVYNGRKSFEVRPGIPDGRPHQVHAV